MINSKHVSIVMAVSIAVLAVVVGIISVLPLTNSLKYDQHDRNDFIDPATYQAVFLTNDQIYFGRLKNISPDHLILSDVYYVKVNESGAGELIKLGQIEPHRPKDEMVINQEHILFWENLSLDSPIVQNIQDYNK